MQNIDRNVLIQGEVVTRKLKSTTLRQTDSPLITSLSFIEHLKLKHIQKRSSINKIRIKGAEIRGLLKGGSHYSLKMECNQEDAQEKKANQLQGGGLSPPIIVFSFELCQSFALYRFLFYLVPLFALLPFTTAVLKPNFHLLF